MEGTIGFVTGFAGNFAPKNWSYCSGQVLNIASNTALFSILGTVYGGNGTTTFALPNLCGRVVVGVGSGPGLSTYVLGQTGGGESDSMTSLQLPTHVHPVNVVASDYATDNDASVQNPVGGIYARDTNGIAPYSNSQTVNMAPWQAALTMAPTGNGVAFPILRPLTAINYVVCMYGVYPARN
jgi:microcystin-dependent protein